VLAEMKISIAGLSCFADNGGEAGARLAQDYLRATDQ